MERVLVSWFLLRMFKSLAEVKYFRAEVKDGLILTHPKVTKAYYKSLYGFEIEL